MNYSKAYVFNLFKIDANKYEMNRFALGVP